LEEAKAEEKAKEKTKKTEEASEHLRTAAEMIERMGYHRRDGEVAELEQVLAGE